MTEPTINPLNVSFIIIINFMLEILPFFILLDQYIFLVISTMSAFSCSQFSSNAAYKITADLLTDSAHYLLASVSY